MVFGKSWMMNTKASSKEYKIQIAGNISLLIRVITCNCIIRKSRETSLSIF